jgi:uncharacterized tellurite resistance protein B-like protein
MNFTRIEKEAINYLLSELMKADGHTDVHEAATLYEINRRLGISVNEAEASFSLSFDESKNIVNEMNLDKKRYVFNLLNQMAATDGNVDFTEKELIKSIFSNS